MAAVPQLVEEGAVLAGALPKEPLFRQDGEGAVDGGEGDPAGPSPGLFPGGEDTAVDLPGGDWFFAAGQHLQHRLAAGGVFQAAFSQKSGFHTAPPVMVFVTVLLYSRGDGVSNGTGKQVASF